MYDMHVHTYRCKHAFGDVEGYVESALEQGLSVLGFNDHCPFSDDRWSNFRMYWLEVENYVAKFLEARQKYQGEIDLYLGFECEYVDGLSQTDIACLRENYPIEYFSFGAHVLPYHGQWLNTYEDMHSVDHVEQYFQYLIAAIDSQLFSFITHPDIFEFAGIEMNPTIRDSIARFLTKCEQKSMVLELNASNYYKISRAEKGLNCSPNRAFWEMVADHDISVIINSDAHFPSDVNKDRSRCFEFADEIGLKLADYKMILSPKVIDEYL